MSNNLKRSLTKALSLLLAFTVSVGLITVINTNNSYAYYENELKTAELTIDVPKCGTEITKVSTWEQSPEPDVKKTDPESPIYVYIPWWCTPDGRDYFSGAVVGDTPLYLAVTLSLYSTEYYWANDGNGNYTGTLTINGKPAEIVSATVENGEEYYLGLVVKLNPEHDWDEGKVTTEPTATTDGVKTYTCKACSATKTEVIPATGGAANSPVLASLTSKGTKGLTFKWSSYAGAEGYDLFLSRCNHGDKKYTPELVNTVTGNDTKSWTKKGLKKGVSYKAYVKPFKMVNGEKQYLGQSKKLHAFTNGGNKYYTNPRKVNVKKASATLTAGQTFKIKGSVSKLKAKKSLLGSDHAAKLRYVSSDESVATVDSKGTITAKAAGNCKVYAIAVNGLRKAVEVTVK